MNRNRLQTFACSKVTARLEVRSDLFPTKSLFTFSEAYLEGIKVKTNYPKQIERTCQSHGAIA
jgi:hypothetical protein